MVQCKPIAGQITPLARDPGGEGGQGGPGTPEGGEATLSTTPALELLGNGLAGGGRPLPEATRAFYETRFGHDFRQVRIHDDGHGGALARSLNAQAFTVGRDIVFAPGAYSPDTAAGRHLLAHELTHTIQQTGGAFPPATGSGPPALQGQFEKPPQLPPPPEYECKIDVIMAARALAGDREAALKVIDCCISHIPVVGRGCTSSVVSAACKLFPDLCEQKKKEKKGPACPFGYRPSRAFPGKCCPEGRETEAENECCAPNQIVSHFGISQCCRPPYVPNDEKTACILRPLDPCPPHRKTPLFERGVFVPRYSCRCLPESRQNLEEGVCCPIGEVGTSGTCVPEGAKPKPPAPPPPAFTVVETLDIGFKKDAPQVWFDPRASFQVSVTPEGKTEFGKLVARLEAHPEEEVQLEARASSDRPAQDGEYNQRLTDRRVRLIAGELQKRKIDVAARVADPPGEGPAEGCIRITSGQSSCGDNGAKHPPDPKDRKVLARVFTVAP